MDIYLEFLIPFACIPILKMSRHSNIKTQFVHRNLMSSLSVSNYHNNAKICNVFFSQKSFCLICRHSNQRKFWYHHGTISYIILCPIGSVSQLCRNIVENGTNLSNTILLPIVVQVYEFMENRKSRRKQSFESPLANYFSKKLHLRDWLYRDF